MSNEPTLADVISDMESVLHDAEGFAVTLETLLRQAATTGGLDEAQCEAAGRVADHGLACMRRAVGCWREAFNLSQRDP